MRYTCRHCGTDMVEVAEILPSVCDDCASKFMATLDVLAVDELQQVVQFIEGLVDKKASE